MKFAGPARTRVGEELDLIAKDRFEFCWIVDFPMFEWSEEEKKIDFSHNPFSMPNMDVEEFLALDPKDNETILGIKAFQYDIVCNGIELSSGAIRNHRPDVMRKAFAIAGYGEDVLEQKFGGMLRALSLGAPPHGGIAPGIDRIVMLLCGEENLREVVLFPMNQRAEDLMMGAPSEVTPKQLRELHIRLNLPEKNGSPERPALLSSVRVTESSMPPTSNVMVTPAYVRTMAAYNAEMNRRLYAAAARIPDSARRLDRGAFWGSLHGTLCHLLWGDQTWMSRFDGWPKPDVIQKDSAGTDRKFRRAAALARRRRRQDQAMGRPRHRRVAGAGPTWFSASVQKELRSPRSFLVAHLFNHQTHHRGQAHALITAFGEPTGDTDLFLVVEPADALHYLSGNGMNSISSPGTF